MVKLPVIPRHEIAVRPVDWTGLPTCYLNAGELELIVALVRSVNPRVMVEIGLAQGRTAKAILRELPDIERYIGIDTGPDYRPRLWGQRTERSATPGYLAMDDSRFELWLRPNGSLDLVADDFPPVDVVFIDGDHSREVVRRDSDLARYIVAPGGLILWHDVHNDGVEVTRVVEHDHSLGHDIRQVEGTWLAFERR